ncbi:hypothetical protein MASR2M69_19320 [Bacteroidota bacterium]
MKKAIVLGGTYDHIKLIEILKKYGYYVLLIDYYENPPAKAIVDEHIKESTLDIDKVLNIAKKFKPDLVISTCIDQALKTMAFVCEELDLPCHISHQSAIELTNKVLMKKKFEENNIPTSKFLVIDNTSDLSNIKLNYPIVIKPADSNSSKGISKINKYNLLNNAVELAMKNSRSKNVILEEFRNGEEYSVDVIIVDYEPEIILITKNIKNKNNKDKFTIIQSYFPALDDLALEERIKLIAKDIAISFKIKNGPLLIQMIFDGKNLNVIECSSRIGGGSKHQIIQEITDFDIINWFVNLIAKNKIRKKIRLYKRSNYACINYIYANKGKIVKQLGFEELKKKQIIKQYYHYKTINSIIDNHTSSTDRSSGILIVDNNYESFIQKIITADRSLMLIDEKGDDIMIHNIYH